MLAPNYPNDTGTYREWVGLGDRPQQASFLLPLWAAFVLLIRQRRHNHPDPCRQISLRTGFSEVIDPVIELRLDRVSGRAGSAKRLADRP